MKNERNLILSPINEYGGVNLEAGFIADIIESNEGIVKIISLGDFYKESSVFHFNKNLDYNSLNRLVYNSSPLIKLITNTLHLFKPRKIPKHFRVENRFCKTIFANTRKKKLKILEKEISKTDKVIICSQLNSKLVKEIVQISFEFQKTLIFRITGQIQSDNINTQTKIWLDKVDVYIHHSKHSLNTLSRFCSNSRHVIIDQNAYLEKKLLKIPIKNRKINKFFTLSRLHSLKQIDLIISAFKKIENKKIILNIYGNGEDELKLKKIAENSSNIQFLGKMEFKFSHHVFKENDCLIIASLKEAGPLTGIEAMASGTQIISTRVGAMTDRLNKDYEYFFDGTQESLIKKIEQILTLDSYSVKEECKNLRKIYISRYKEAEIRKKYLDVILNSIPLPHHKSACS